MISLGLVLDLELSSPTHVYAYGVYICELTRGVCAHIRTPVLGLLLLPAFLPYHPRFHCHSWLSQPIGSPCLEPSPLGRLSKAQCLTSCSVLRISVQGPCGSLHFRAWPSASSQGPWVGWIQGEEFPSRQAPCGSTEQSGLTPDPGVLASSPYSDTPPPFPQDHLLHTLGHHCLLPHLVRA